jgi:predicted alpha-1,2-mannosidase
LLSCQVNSIQMLDRKGYLSMMRKTTVALGLLVFILPFVVMVRPAHAQSLATLNLTQYVNPFIGTDDSTSPNPVGGGAGGSTFPGADVPFGMVQFSPDTPTASPSGYRYKDTSIEDFSMTHFDGAGCSNNEDINILPITGALSASPGNSWTSYTSGYTKSNESATPGYYKNYLDKYSTGVELTSTTRTGMAKFTFPSTTQATVLVNDSRMATADRSGSVTLVGNNEIDGSATGGGFCGSNNTYPIYFVAQFDQSFTSSGTWSGGSISNGSTSASGTQTGAFVTFNTTSNQVVQMKVGLSYVSLANAKSNLTSENPNWSFSTTQANASTSWNTVLNRIQVSSGASADLTKFYTALYHAFQDPTVASDVNGQYYGFDNAVHTIPSTMKALYANFSGWDIYRSWAALMGMISPEMNDISQSMVLDGQQGGHGLPKWSQQNVEDYIMTGDPGPIIVASGYAFGARNFDTASALTLMNTGGTTGSSIRGNQGTYTSLHYVPGNASDSQEYSASDFAIAQFAQALGDTTKYNYFMNHAQWWINVYNQAVSFAQARNSDGTWANSPLDPASQSGFTEGNSAQYTWMVPYNISSLINLMGGPQTAVQRLDHLFTQLNAGTSLPYFYMGNEPEFSTPWVYNFAQAPWKTQNIVRQILNTEYTTDQGGLPGNDDLGATSGVAVWGYLGIYPVVPGTDVLAFNGPTFPSATITLANGKTLQINGTGAGQGNQYIQSFNLNGGASTTQNWMHYSDIMNGGTLNFTMGSSPNTSWGSNASDVPPSYNDGFTPPAAAPNLGTNLALGKSTTSSATCASTESADKAVDGTLTSNSKWCSASSPIWWQVDLGSNQTVGSFVIKHAGLGGETTGWNTGAYNIQISTDNTNWTTVVNVSGNTNSRTLDSITPQTARYVKLNITTPTNNGNNAARIYEVEVYSNGSSSGNTLFSTGLESGQPQPTWTNTVETANGGSSNVGGILSSLSGPELGVRNEATVHDGSAALMYSGMDNSASSSFAYMKVFDLSASNITLTSTTKLSYWIYPQSTATSNLVSGSNSTCVAIDIVFSDGSNLRDSGVTDQNGNRLHPASQCGHLTLDQWNNVIANLGNLSGKTISRIVVGYDQPANTGGYRGYIDTISITK